ncbi:class I SAM-dependent methyltransferase [Fulvivirgaceae bacterium BMA12]|uniref:Class I SAM-dependent methyltransferase n=1 Tax=Agaribacillus aureus TaxID=3051825 RepID=A0ABT8LE39_9BACT|nr:class I SAM-dependent methyltransferase [Fulvivirgaceae bacterium BMA12]
MKFSEIENINDMKNLFSANSENYERFRPDYPDALYKYIFQYVRSFDQAWDCATGNGQAAKYLSTVFKQVEASDISDGQLDNAYQNFNIHYRQSPAESTPFKDNRFDLITVAQAFHWFNFEQFFREAKRVLKPGGVLAVWTYDLLKIEDRIDQAIGDFYHNVVGPYWESERKHVDRRYGDVKFPFRHVQTETFSIKKEWSLQQLIGYVQTWSSVAKYQKDHRENPVNALHDQLKQLWTHGVYEIIFPTTVFVAFEDQ